MVLQKKTSIFWLFCSMNKYGFSEHVKIRGSIYEAFYLDILAWRATWDSLKKWNLGFQKMIEKSVSPQLTEIHFPGLGTLRFAILTTDVLFFLYVFGHFLTDVMTVFLTIFRMFPYRLPLTVVFWPILSQAWDLLVHTEWQRAYTILVFHRSTRSAWKMMDKICSSPITQAL